MSNGETCNTCWNTRWLIALPSWKEGGMAAKLMPFDKGGWKLLGDAVLAGLLASKALRPCGACNERKLPPWAKEWRGGGDAAPAGDDATPF